MIWPLTTIPSHFAKPACLLLEPPSYCLRVFVLLFPPLVLEISTGLKPSPLRFSLQCLLNSDYTDHAT